MDAPPGTRVVLELDPADHVVEVADAADLAGSSLRRSDGAVLLRLRDLHAPPSTSGLPFGTLELTRLDPALSFSDAVFLATTCLLTGRHHDVFLHLPHLWRFVDHASGQQVDVPHPPRIETVWALLARLDLPTRIRVLVEACELAVPVWTRWAATANLRYFDGIMSMAMVDQDLAESTIAALWGWLADGDTTGLERRSGDYRALHWPMLEDEWTCPDNVYYSLFAPCNAARSALADGDLDLAFTCLRQAAAARATSAADEFLGEPFRRAFLLAWWRACLRVFCAR